MNTTYEGKMSNLIKIYKHEERTVLFKKLRIIMYKHIFLKFHYHYPQ